VSREVEVSFSPSGKRGRVAAGTSILDAAHRLAVDIDGLCGGRAICGRCAVSVGATDVSEPTAAELRHMEKRSGWTAGRRLGCQTRIVGDLRVDVPPESRIHRPVLRKRAEARKMEVDPVVALHYVEVVEPDMSDPASDFTRLAAALSVQWGIKDVVASLSVLAGLQVALRAGGWKATVALRSGRDVVAVYPGFKDRVFGLAVDIGSTTIAAHLCDLASGDVVASAGRMNPQIRYGDDLMSRVSHIMMHPESRADMTRLVREAIRETAEEAARLAHAEPGEIVEAVLVGNPIMHHLALGIDPTELGGAPFALAVDGAVDVPAAELALDFAPGAHAHVLPCIAGHVGADTSGVVLSEGPHLGTEMMLLVDIGTNAEIVLGNRDRLIACSSPTGPAFEGAQISSGQRAVPGAIERLRIDPATLNPRYRVVGCDLWSDEAGFAEATRATGITGICGSGIIEAMVELLRAGIIAPDGAFDPEAARRSARVVPDGRSHAYVIREAADGRAGMAITQADVRAVQLAKAALYAGIRLLMDRIGVGAVDRIVLAGAFGSHIDVAYAMALGLIPDCDLAKVVSAGNAAGTGARLALVSAKARREIAEVARRIEKVETAIEPAFQAHFVDAMALPHRSHRFPHLQAKFADSPKLWGGPPEGGTARPGRRSSRGAGRCS
jgi:uncharacterized 2Fe-2S/4Fe-4S cluster protein (DUF4445 family)